MMRQLRSRLSGAEWTAIIGMTGAIALLHILGWAGLLLLVAPHHYALGPAGVYGVGLGVTAYTLGMRHAFDADHIAAIDNTTRKLMAGGRRPLTVGFWFSLGHSSVVFALCLLLSLGIRSLAGQVSDDASTLQQVTGTTGTAISGLFLYLIAAVNLVVLIGILRVFRDLRRGKFDQTVLEAKLADRGLLNRVLRRVTSVVGAPWQMYAVGLLFGLGFDTATEISLLVLAGGAAAFHLPWYAICVLPVLFAAGMSLLDSLDGCFMNFAYGWAFSQPVRRIYYNLTVTGLSVAVAFGIGTIELAWLLTNQLGIDSGPLAAIGELDLNNVGYGVVGLFVLTWAIAVAVWKLGRFEERWTDRSIPTAE